MAPIKVGNNERDEKEDENNKPPIKKDAWIDVSSKPPSYFEKDLENAITSEKSRNPFALAIAWKAHRFTDNMTMHGIRYIFSHDIGFFRR